MAILIDEKTVALVQGITGREGSKATKQMLDYGTKVVCGVTPGKGGETVEGLPVYNTVGEALARHKNVNASTVYVPPVGVKDAVLEAVGNGIQLVHVFAEKVPILDSAQMYAFAREKKATVVGPSSIGLISPRKAKLGSIGGATPGETFDQGFVGLLSKSGGMTREIAWLLKKEGLGCSTAIGVGGDMIACSTFADLMQRFEADKETRAIVLFGEHGGTYENQAAEWMAAGKVKKPVIALVAGKFAQAMPESIQLGHAGAMIEGGCGTTEEKIKALKDAGARIARVPDDIPGMVKEAVGRK